jgi:hypothetical protein
VRSISLSPQCAYGRLEGLRPIAVGRSPRLGDAYRTPSAGQEVPHSPERLQVPSDVTCSESSGMEGNWAKLWAKASQPSPHTPDRLPVSDRQNVWQLFGFGVFCCTLLQTGARERQPTGIVPSGRETRRFDPALVRPSRRPKCLAIVWLSVLGRPELAGVCMGLAVWRREAINPCEPSWEGLEIGCGGSYGKVGVMERCGVRPHRNLISGLCS